MKRILTLLLVLIGYFAAAQTQPTLPPGSQIYSSNLFLAPDSTVWTGKAGLYINLGSKRIFDQLLAAKVDTAALNSYYTKAQVDAFLLLKEDLANKVTDLNDPNDTTYPTTKAVKDAIDAIPPTDLSNYYDKQETDDLLDTKIDTALLDKPNGIPLMDANGKIKIVNIPDQLIGAVNYQGTWSPATNTPTLPAVPGPETKGHYYVASDSAEFNGQVYRPNDWIISSGSEWQIIEATNYVRRVNGKTGDVVLTAADVSGAVQTLSQPSIGQLAISGGNTVNLNTVNMSGNQAGIAGEKTWVGRQFFGWQSNDFGSMSTAGTHTNIFIRNDEGTVWNIQREASSQNFRINRYIENVNQGASFLIENATGSVGISNLSGTGNGIVGVTSNGTLTRTNVSDFGYVPYTGATSGVDLGTQNLTLNGLFYKQSNTLQKTDLTVGGTTVSFKRYDSPASFAITSSSLHRDIIIKLPEIHTSTVAGWIAEVLLYAPTNTSGLGVPVKLVISANNLTGSNRAVSATGSSQSISEVRFGRINDAPVLVIKSSGGTTDGFMRVELTKFYTTINPMPAQDIKSNYSITLGDEADLVDYTYVGSVTNAQFVRDPYYLDYNNLTNTPSIPELVNADWDAVSGAAEILNKPTIGDGTLTLETGTGLQGSASFSANQSGNATFTVEAASGYAIPTTTKQSEWDDAYAYSEVGHIPLSQKGAVNGVATLNAGGVIPWEQLPTSNPYKGTWDASTNTPSIADGTGTAGDYYRVNIAGTQDLGSGNITFAVGDDVIYSGTVWQRVPGGAVASNLGIGTHNGTSIEITNSNGTGFTLPAATTLLAGLQSAADKVLLNSAIQPGDNLSDLTNDAGFIVGGTGDAQVRTNLQLDGRYAQLTGAAFTGPVLWSTAPTLDAHLTNKEYVDGLIAGLPTGLELGETETTAYRGDRGKEAYDYSQIGHLELTGGTVTGQIKRDGDAVAGDDLPRLSQVQALIGDIDLTNYIQIGDNISELVNDLNYTAAGSNITLFNNNAGYIVEGTGADQVRSNADLDGRYIQTEVDPTVPQHVKDIALSDLSNWNSKISSVTGGAGITVDATDPYNPIISASAQSLIFTGDVTGVGEGTIELTLADDSVKTQHLADTAVTTAKLGNLSVTTDKIAQGAVTTSKIDTLAVTEGKLADTAVTTAKLRDKAVTLDKVQQILQGHVIGAPGTASNPWYLIEDTSWGFSAWADYFTYSPVGRHCYYEGRVYRSRIDNNLNNRPDISPSAWEDVGAWKGYWASPNATFLEQEFEPGDVVYITNNPGYTDFTGLLKTDVEVTELVPGAPLTPEYVDAEMLNFGEGFLIEGNEIKVAGSNSITGLILPGSNVTITGTGTPGSPYYINSTAGGAGSSTLAGLTDVSVNAATNGDVLGYVDGLWVATPQTSYTLPTATTSLLGGIKLGSNTVQSVAANAPSSEAGKTYPVQLNSSGQAVVNVPWESGGYTLPTASASVLGGIRIGSGLSIDGAGVVSVTGGGGSDFRLRSGTNAYLSNDVTLLAGTNVTLSQAGQNITINATGGGISALTGDVLASGTGSVSATIANGAVTNAKMANMAANTLKGRMGTSGAPTDLDRYQINSLLNTSRQITAPVIIIDTNKGYYDVTSSTTMSLQGTYVGFEYQLEVTNSTGSDHTLSFVTDLTGGSTVYVPEGVDTVVPAGKTVVFSFASFRSGSTRLTKVVY